MMRGCVALPSGVEGLYDLAVRPVMRICGMVDRGEAVWTSLPPAAQEEIEEALKMLAEAGAQGHVGANNDLGFVLRAVHRDVAGAEVAFRAAIAVDPRHAQAHYNLGLLLDSDLKDAHGAEAAFRAAIAADPKHVEALISVGGLVIKERNDLDGAEAAFRAAIAVDPGHSLARNSIANLLLTRATEIDNAGSDPAAAAALYEEAAVHFTRAFTKRVMTGRAADLRRALSCSF